MWAPNSDSVTLVRLTEADYAKASFLDARAVGPQTMTRNLSFSALDSAVTEAGLAEAANFIFHIGHVGSTLVSRLLGDDASVFSLREPAILRTLAEIRAGGVRDEEAFERRRSTFLKLWSRVFRPGQRALIKATSYASELAPEILARPSQPKAIFMFVPPENFLASILGAEHSPREARELAPLRAARLNRRLGLNIRAETLSPGEVVVLGWACEMTALAAAPSDRVLWLDFDRFLADPSSQLARCLDHLGIATSREQIDAIVTGPDMRRYSKAQEHDYDAKLRGKILAQARADQGSEIKHGLDWLDKIAATSPAVAAAIQISGTG
jgi:hypothetical protein